MTVFTPTKARDPFFYRYQTAIHLDWLKPVILNHLLYLPTAAQLNDPTDCRPKIKTMSTEDMVTFLKKDYVRRTPVVALDLLREHEEKIRSDIRTQGMDWFQREVSSILNAHTENFRVFSLSKRFNNLSLWAKYADNHKGYCLEFKNVGPLFGEHVMEVVYGEYAPFDLNDSDRSADFLVTKRPEWSNEEEIRLIRVPGSGQMVMIEPQWLTRIILGRCMSSESEKQIRKWCTQRIPELAVANAYLDEFHQEIRLK
jgi:hypothetical protein